MPREKQGAQRRDSFQKSRRARHGLVCIVLIFSRLLLEPIIVGHSLSWYDASLRHLIHHSTVIASGCNIYHSDIVVVTGNVWMPEMLSSPSSARASSSPAGSTIPLNVSAGSTHHSVPRLHSDDSDDEAHRADDGQRESTPRFNSTYLPPMPSQWEMPINGNNFLPIYNHHHHHHQQQQQQEQQTAIYEDDHVWYERLRSMATSIGSEQPSSSDSSSNDIQQHHQLFDVYSQPLPPPMMTSVSVDPHMTYYSSNHPFDHYHPHHLPEYQTMFSF